MRRDPVVVDAVIVVPSAYGPLALSPEALAEALARGRAVLPISEPTITATAQSAPAPERLLDAERLAEATGVPASWWADQAWQAHDPLLQVWEVPRFSLAEILKSPKFKELRRTGTRWWCHAQSNMRPEDKRSLAWGHGALRDGALAA